MSMTARMYKRLVMKFKGIPVVYLVYRPWRKGKNVDVYRLPPFVDDEYIQVRCDEIAHHIRALYQDKLDELIKRGSENDG